MKSYLNNQMVVDRLKKEYQQHGSLIIGFDFDCTIFDYHNEGLELEPVKELLRKCSKLGFTMCLYSLSLSETAMNLEAKAAWCKENLGFSPDYINSSPALPPHLQNTSHTPKPFFSILLDDRAGLVSAYEALIQVLIDLRLY